VSFRIIITCEHGGNRVPARYAGLFRGKKKLLDSHRGYDIGALALAKALSRALESPLHYTETSRLLVDCNRSRVSRNLFSDITRRLDEGDRRDIIQRHYEPYREKVQGAIEGAVDAGDAVVHLSVHSFTPVLDGKRRDADIGLLYDPSRPLEKEFCRRLAPLIGKEVPGLRIRMNYPYRGTSDGFTTHLRTVFPPEAYLGIEIEANQALLVPGRRRR